MLNANNDSWRDYKVGHFDFQYGRKYDLGHKIPKFFHSGGGAMVILSAMKRCVASLRGRQPVAISHVPPLGIAFPRDAGFHSSQ